MRHYEIVALVHPDQSDQMDELSARYRKIVEDSDGTVHRYENWGRRRLAYPIQNLFKAGYILMNVECEPNIKNEIENAFRYNDHILRSLVIRKNKAVTGPSPILLNKQKQEEKRLEEERAIAESARAKQQEAEAKQVASVTEESNSDDTTSEQSDQVKSAAKSTGN